MFRPVPVQPQAASPGRVSALLALLGALLVFAAPAQAAKISFGASDPKGDGKSVAGLDLLKAEGTYDNATGAFKVSATMAAPFAGAQGLLTFFIGTARDGKCDYTDPGLDGIPPFMQFYIVNHGSTEIPPVYSYSTQEISGKAEVTRSGNTLTMSSPATPVLVNLPLDCMYVATAYDTPSGGAIADDLFSFVVTDPSSGPPRSDDGDKGNGSGSGSGSGSGTTPLKIVTTEADADKDGVPDSADKCPSVPGALANGCPVMKTADEFRLGAKRVVVDKLVAMTGKSCPPRVRITVTSKGKKIGTGVFTVDQHGSFCRVNGIVRIKAKKKAVRVTTKGTGMTSIAKSVRR